MIELIFFYFAGVEGGQHERRLLDELLTSYNILERPVPIENETLQLSFGLTLMQIIDVVCAKFDVVLST